MRARAQHHRAVLAGRAVDHRMRLFVLESISEMCADIRYLLAKLPPRYKRRKSAVIAAKKCSNALRADVEFAGQVASASFRVSSGLISKDAGQGRF